MGLDNMLILTETIKKQYWSEYILNLNEQKYHTPKKREKLYPDIIVHGTIIKMTSEILLFNGKNIF